MSVAYPAQIGTIQFGPTTIDLKGKFLLASCHKIIYISVLLIITARVTHYLDTTFYNLTTVALHDWNTYAQMRSLATQKYGLDLVDPALPSQTLEQVRFSGEGTHFLQACITSCSV
jgi:hypothetical protein